MLRPSPALRRLSLPAIVIAALALVSTSAGAPGERGRKIEPRPKGSSKGVQLFDVRAAAAAEPGTASAAQENLRRSLGLLGVVDVDPLTGTPRVVAKLDGFLTGSSSRDAKDIALDYVRAHPGVFGLDKDDLAGLRISRDYTDLAGVRHLVWAQTVGGVATFDNDLRANVTADGRLINILGSPLPDLSDRVEALMPSLEAVGAVGAALRSVGRDRGAPRVVARSRGPQRSIRFAGGHRAKLLLFNTPRGIQLAWRVLAFADADEVYDTVVDASSGEVLRRVNEVAGVDGLAHGYYPGATVGGAQQSRTFPVSWNTNSARLEGDFVHVFRDVNDDDLAGASEQVFPSDGTNWNYLFDPFTPVENPGGQCSPSTCSWESSDSGNGVTTQSWRTNDEQNATQIYYFVNTFHDWLADPAGPFGFDAASGGFEVGDKVKAHANDGANLGGGTLGTGMPDDGHLSNANMLTEPDGTSPIMQMFLFAPSPFDPADPTPDVNGGDDASIIYHEYTHGLSNRLITYSDGFGALDASQSGAMGEAWSDWYAMDFLASHSDAGFEVAPFYVTDTASEGEVVIGSYVTNGGTGVRTQALDCPVGSTAPNCLGFPSASAGSGGYSYGDYGKVLPFGPEVHADGEIWAQTLWDLRDTIDHTDARFLITEAMRLSPENPSFLDMRNAILQADVADAGTDNSAAIWQVFANRGMGFFAHSTNGNDVEPSEDFAPPPDPNVTGTLQGTVRDFDAGTPLAGALVTAGNQTATTNASGQFSLVVPAANYPNIFVTKTGYEDAAGPASVTDGGTTTVEMRPRRDWSSQSGGAVIQTFTGPSYADFGCGPSEAIDGALITGWSTDTPGEKRIVVRLPKFIDVTSIKVDPGAVCGDAASASTRQYKIEVSKNNAAWTKIRDASFAANPADGLQSAFTGLRRGVRYVRFTIKSNWGDAQFMDMSELAVYGKATVFCLGVPVTRIGTEGKNTINGTGGADVILALGGHDKVYGKGGPDTICGGSGNDTIVGGAGVDKIDAGSGNDTVNSKDGVRELTIRGGPGTDRLRRDANDRVTGFERKF